MCFEAGSGRFVLKSHHLSKPFKWLEAFEMVERDQSPSIFENITSRPSTTFHSLAEWSRISLRGMYFWSRTLSNAQDE